MVSSQDVPPGHGHPVMSEVALVGCRSAHRRLVANLEAVDDDLARIPSRLPGWTVGHVLTHLARNADSHVRMLEGAVRGEHLEQYPAGRAGRAADIEAGACRPALALAGDVAHSAARLEQAWAVMTPEAWQGYGLAWGRQLPCWELPLRRWREVEVHHVDLGIGYEALDWPEDYVAAELPLALAALPGRLPDSEARQLLLAWLLGRAEPDAVRLDPWEPRPGP